MSPVMSERETLRLVIRSFLLILLILAMLWFAWAVRGVLVMVLVAVILAIGLSPLVDALAGTNRPKSRIRVPRPIAVLLIYAVLISILAAILLLVIPPLLRQLNTFVQNLPFYIAELRKALRELGNMYPALQELGDRIPVPSPSSVGSIGDITSQFTTVLQFLSALVGGILSLVFILVLTFYLIVDGDNIYQGVFRLLPPENRAIAHQVAIRSRAKIGAWLIGEAALASIIGIVTFIGLTVLGLPYPLLLAVVAAIGELIPMVGPFLSAIPPIIVAAFIDPILAIATAVFYLAVQQFENHVVVPMVMKRAVDLPPAVVIVALLMGGEILGIAGAILALPIAAIVSIVVSELVSMRDNSSVPPSAPTPPPELAEVTE